MRLLSELAPARNTTQFYSYTEAPLNRDNGAGHERGEEDAIDASVNTKKEEKTDERPKGCKNITEGAHVKHFVNCSSSSEVDILLRLTLTFTVERRRKQHKFTSPYVTRLVGISFAAGHIEAPSATAFPFLLAIAQSNGTSKQSVDYKVAVACFTSPQPTATCFYIYTATKTRDESAYYAIVVRNDDSMR
uniref:Uncharacterized protein n=1 Tax=Panagrellus redivivus TaxID=6233 RepID=A0A7E4ULX1_PANRE